MSLLTKKIPENLLEETLRAFESMDKPTKDWLKMDSYMNKKLNECNLLLKEDPHNEILLHNKEIILLIALTIRLGCFL